MARPLFRVRISGPTGEFQPLVIVPGQVMLERWNSNAQLLGQWLGRFVAEPVWHEDAVHFFLRDEQGTQLAGVSCEPATAADLAGPLKAEFAQLKDRLRRSAPTSPAARTLHEFACRGLLDARGDHDFVGLACQFFKYRDIQGQARLVWCYGFEPAVKRGDARPVICRDADCALLQMRHAGSDSKCSACGKPLDAPSKPRSRRMLAAAVVLLLVVSAGVGLAIVGRWDTPAARVPGERPTIAPTAQLAGRVVYRSPEEEVPIEGATMTVGEGRGAVTDAEGRCRLDGLAPGIVKFAVNAQGFQEYRGEADASVETGEPLVVVLIGAGRVSGKVVYAADPTLPLADADLGVDGFDGSKARSDANGDFRLESLPPGEVRVSVTAAGFAPMTISVKTGDSSLIVRLAGDAVLTGEVLRADTKEAVADAEVLLPDTPFSGRTNQRGEFRLEGVRSGPARLKAAAPGLAGSLSLDLAARQTTAVQVMLRGSLTVTGRVVDAISREPIAAATVSVADTDLKATTDVEGRYTLTGNAPAAPKLTVTAEGFLPAEASVEQDNVETDEIALRPAAILKGRVLRALDKTPLEGAVVEVAESGERAMTSGDGTFQLAPVPAGAAAISAVAEGYEPQRREQTLERGPQTLDDMLLEGNTLTKGVTLDALDKDRRVPHAKLEVVIGDYRKELTSDQDGAFELGKLPPGVVEVTARAPDFLDAKVTQRVAPGDARIEIPLLRLIVAAGVVIDATDKKKPVDKAEVELISAAGTHKATSAANGRFEASGVAPGAVLVRVERAGYAAARLPLELDPQKPWLVVPLQPLLTVQGLVVDAEDPRRPVAQARIRAQLGELTATATSGANGRFTLSLPAGYAEATAQADGYCETTVRPAITAAGPRFEIRMPRGRTLRGQVVNAVNNQPLSGAAVEVDGGGETKIGGKSNASGAFEITSVPARAAVVHVSAAGFEPLAVSAPAQSASPLRIVLSPEILPGEARLVLTWNERPRDLDGHLYGPLVDGSRYHVSFKERMADGATLDVDAKEGLGPETITMKASTGTYQYFVAHSENLGTGDGQGLQRSAAQVRVYYKGAKSNLIYVLRANVTGPVWHVFDITVDALGAITMVPKNKFYRNLPEK